MTPSEQALLTLSNSQHSYDVSSQRLQIGGATMGEVHVKFEFTAKQLPELTALDFIDIGWAVKNELIRIYTERYESEKAQQGAQ